MPRATAKMPLIWIMLILCRTAISFSWCTNDATCVTRRRVCEPNAWGGCYYKTEYNCRSQSNPQGTSPYTCTPECDGISSIASCTVTTTRDDNYNKCAPGAKSEKINCDCDVYECGDGNTCCGSSCTCSLACKYIDNSIWCPTPNPTPSPTSLPTVPTSNPTSNPTPPPTTYSPTGSPTITADRHKIVAGHTKSSADKPVQCANNDAISDEIGVQCCTQDGSSAYRKGFTNGIGSDKCLQGVTYTEAKAACQNRGDRLCTAQEVASNIGGGKGCSHDHRHVWTSDGCISAHKIVSGHTKSSNDKQEECADDTQTTGIGSNNHGNEIAVQCCKDLNPPQIVKSGSWWNPIIKVVTVSAYRTGFANGIGSSKCLQGVTYNEAKTSCENRGDRLCTAKEVKSDIGGGTGCMHDYRHVWTSDYCGDIETYLSSNPVKYVINGMYIYIILALIFVLVLMNVFYLCNKICHILSIKSKKKYSKVAQIASDDESEIEI